MPSDSEDDIMILDRRLTVVAVVTVAVMVAVAASVAAARAGDGGAAPPALPARRFRAGLLFGGTGLHRLAYSA